MASIFHAKNRNVTTAAAARSRKNMLWVVSPVFPDVVRLALAAVVRGVVVVAVVLPALVLVVVVRLTVVVEVGVVVPLVGVGGVGVVLPPVGVGVGS